MKESIVAWFQENKERFLLLLGVFLVGVLCFEAGLLLGKTAQETPLVLSLPPVPIESLSQAEPVPSTQSQKTLTREPIAAKGGVADCVFVGSKNSNKYHLPTCTVAKRIKPENRVCFASKEEAEKRGYVPSCLK